MGGLIYIVNLVNALNHLPDEEKPEVIVFYNKDLERLTKEMRYPFLTLVEKAFINIYWGYWLTWMTGKNAFYQELIANYGLDGVYPANDQPIQRSAQADKLTKMVAWIPDLQHKFYPHFFGKLRILLRELRIRITLRNSYDLVVSSHDVESHFRKSYLISSRLRIHVVQFASINELADSPPIDVVRTKYQVPNDYFLVSNQFTNHKNHGVVLEALSELSKRGVKVHVVFTGKMEFKQNTEYIHSIRQQVSSQKLEALTSFLDVIPRSDQLCLMTHARAVIQPSLFEGWSTVIEDAISLQVPVIASNLAVNVEQLGDKGQFFDPGNAEQLADILAAFPNHLKTTYGNYDERIANFASRFVKIFK